MGGFGLDLILEGIERVTERVKKEKTKPVHDAPCIYRNRKEVSVIEQLMDGNDSLHTH